MAKENMIGLGQGSTYSPMAPPHDLDYLGEYIYNELVQISSRLKIIAEGRFLQIYHVPPERPREGMLAIADGVDWNPGGQKGLYEYRDGAWRKL